MKKYRGLIITGSILLGAGLIAFAVFMNRLNWDFKELDTEVFEAKTYFAPVEEARPVFDRVKVDIRTGDVDLVFGDTLRVDYEESDSVKTRIGVEDGRLTVSQEVKWHLFSVFTFKRAFIKTVITLPEGLYDVELSADSGSPTVAGGGYRTLDIDSDNGKIVLSGIVCEGLAAHSDNGKIELTDVRVSGGVSARSRNGKVTLKNLTADGGLKIDADNGRVELTGVTANAAEVSAGNGAVEYDGLIVNRLRTSADNGRILFGGLVCPDIYLKSGNGRIEGNILGIRGEYTVSLTGKNGRIDPAYDAAVGGDKKLTAESDNGSIKITFSE
ncbi:MAG: DUF4097 domain-containing protein [Clostridiales bacterium]|jgi:DUF4097 and DUF4098 domain-containing protein YvlB|nr:DUF4097 domain-containing protein [Clostridiales bacterium]